MGTKSGTWIYKEGGEGGGYMQGPPNTNTHSLVYVRSSVIHGFGCMRVFAILF